MVSYNSGAKMSKKYWKDIANWLEHTSNYHSSEQFMNLPITKRVIHFVWVEIKCFDVNIFNYLKWFEYYKTIHSKAIYVCSQWL